MSILEEVTSPLLTDDRAVSAHSTHLEWHTMHS